VHRINAKATRKNSELTTENSEFTTENTEKHGGDSVLRSCFEPFEPFEPFAFNFFFARPPSLCVLSRAAVTHVFHR